MNLALQGKSAFITGASRGIGYAIARRLREEGVEVFINGRDSATLEQAAQTLGAHPVAGDVSDPAVCAALAAEMTGARNGLDILVCNVGSGRSVPPGSEDHTEWRRMLDLNLLSATNCVRAFEALLTAARGSIVCVSSICGIEALGCPIAYAGAKAALNSFVRNVARPLGKRGVRINAVAPGNILFPGSTWERKIAADPQAVAAMLEREVALGRLGSADEIADFVAFLASPRSAFATGSVLTVDGGHTRG